GVNFRVSSNDCDSSHRWHQAVSIVRTDAFLVARLLTSAAAVRRGLKFTASASRDCCANRRACERRLSTHFHEYTNVFVLHLLSLTWHACSCREQAHTALCFGKENVVSWRCGRPNIRYRIFKSYAPE